MKKKPKLLNTLLTGEKRRHHVAAFVTQEADWNQHEPNTGFARMFIAMLILHVLIIGGIILSDSSSGTKTPKSPAAQALLTKSANEISSTPTQSASKTPDTDANGVKYDTYQVRSGDSLPMIVARFGVDRDELISLNRLDSDNGFSAGTVLKIPNNKVNAPLQISPARPLPPTAVALSSSPDAEPAAVTPAPDAPADATTASSTPSAPSSFVAMAPGADSASGLVPLPDVTSSSTAPVPSPAETTVVEAATLADTPPAAESTPAVSKSDSVAVTPEPEKPAVKKTAPVNTSPKPRPVPVPPPSEMKKRPVAKVESKADSPPKTETKTKTDAAKPSGKGGAHTLAKGETLYRLSTKYGVSIDSLIKANNIKDPAKLRDGTKLVIPAK